MKGYRFEFKYRMSPSTARSIENYITRFAMNIDEHATEPDGSYFVSSLYLDSFRLTDYLEKASGNIKRKKIRLRIYEPFLDRSDFVRFEIKHKNDMTNRKTKMTLSKPEAEEFIKLGKSVILKKQTDDKKSKNKILEYLNYNLVKPSTLVTYQRRAYMNHNKSLRITFDYNLRAGRQRNFKENKFMAGVNKGGYVMEVKFNYNLPFWMKDVIRKYKLQRDTFSKYERSLEEINKYNQLLR